MTVRGARQSLGEGPSRFKPCPAKEATGQKRVLRVFCTSSGQDYGPEGGGHRWDMDLEGFARTCGGTGQQSPQEVKP
jgi:hypothetical protein